MPIDGGMTIIVKGAGDLASGVAHRLYAAGFVPVMTELPRPLVVRRTVSFAQAIYDGEAEVEGVRAVLASTCEEAKTLREQGIIPVLVDPQGESVSFLQPTVLIDATMAKRNTGISMTDAPAVIALGPGFCAGVDVHAVVETVRGHYMGRVILQGPALADTGVPGPVNGYTMQRLLKAPTQGVFRSRRRIKERVAAGEVVGYVGDTPVTAQLDGVLRGLIADGCEIGKGVKIGEVDPRGVVEYCDTISDKARAIAGGVLEAMLHLLLRRGIQSKGAC